MKHLPAVAVLALSSALMLSACGGGQEPPAQTPTASTTASASPSRSPTATADAGPQIGSCMDDPDDSFLPDFDMLDVQIEADRIMTTGSLTFSRDFPAAESLTGVYFQGNGGSWQFGIRTQMEQVTEVFLFDFSDATNEEVGSATLDGPVLNFAIPRDMRGTEWQAFASFRGSDIDFCPGDDGLSAFMTLS